MIERTNAVPCEGEPWVRFAPGIPEVVHLIGLMRRHAKVNRGFASRQALPRWLT
jgi:hypothetical protein